MMKHLVALFLFLGPATAYAAGNPDIPVDSRIKILTYTSSDVYTVPTKYGYQTSIVFAHNEEIKTVSVGDRSMWQIIPSANRIFIRPMDDNLATNMTVITNQREYNFDIKSVAADQTSNLYVVQFRYPENRTEEYITLNDGDMPPLAHMSSPVTLTHTSTGSNVTIPPLDTQRTQDINEQYTYTGSDALAPSQVYDDGKNTYVLYDAMPSPAPRPTVLSTTGKPAVAKHEVQGNKIIIHTVASGFVLKSPKGKITVYNELFHP